MPVSRPRQCRYEATQYDGGHARDRSSCGSGITNRRRTQYLAYRCWPVEILGLEPVARIILARPGEQGGILYSYTADHRPASGLIAVAGTGAGLPQGWRSASHSSGTAMAASSRPPRPAAARGGVFLPYLVHRVGVMMSADGIGCCLRRSSDVPAGQPKCCRSPVCAVSAEPVPQVPTRQGLSACRYFGAAGGGCPLVKGADSCLISLRSR